jgi:hypothetical protein
MKFEVSFTFPVPVAWEKRFIAAVSEEAWLAAIQVLHASGPLSLTRAAACPRVANALARLLLWAPIEVVASVRRHLDPEVFPRDSDEVFRFSALLRISQAHLELASWFGNRAQLAGAYSHTLLSLSGLLVPRTRKHEMVISAGMLQFAKFVGRAEQGLAEQRPELEQDPKLVAPTAEWITKAIPASAGYDPRALADLIQRCLIEVAASDSMMLSVLQSAFELAHWPSWRALIALDRPPRIQALAARLLNEEASFSPGARNHLAALAAGGTGSPKD